jgi:hypothetical protein
MVILLPAIIIALLTLVLALAMKGLPAFHERDDSVSLFGPRGAWRCRSYGFGNR